MIHYLVPVAIALGAVVCTRRRPMWTLYGIMLAVPFSYQARLMGHPLYFLVELMLIPFVLVVFFTNQRSLASLKISPFIAFIPFVVYVALSLVWAESHTAVLKELVRWGEFTLLGMTAAYVIDRHQGFYKVPTFLGGVGMLVSIAGIAQFLKGINQSKFRPGAAFLGHPNPTAAFLSLCILPVLGLLTQDGRNRLIKYLSMFFILVLGLAFTFSRGVILSCVIGSAYFMFSAIRAHLLRNRRVTAVLVGILVILSSLFVIPRFRTTAINRVITLSGLGERQYIFAFGWSVYKLHPWLGLGAGNLKTYALQNHLEVHKGEPFEPNYGDLHNLFLELMVEDGIFGLLLFLGGLVGFGVLLKSRDQIFTPEAVSLDRALSAATLTFLLANISGLYVVKAIHLEWAVLLAVQAALAQTIEHHVD
jgi:O-antigen ligase